MRNFSECFASAFSEDKEKIFGIDNFGEKFMYQDFVARIENETQKIKIEEQEKFEKIIMQVAHDICSPLASMEMVIKRYKNEIPPSAQAVLWSVSENIKSVVDDTLRKCKKSRAYNYEDNDEQQSIILSLLLSQVIGEKRYQYQESSIEFNFKFDTHDNFASIKASPVSFKKMVSNWVSDAVEALEDRAGEINLKLITKEDEITIVIEGYDKTVLTFQRTSPPDWIVKEIKLNQGDTLIILDDEESFHNAWDIRFEPYKSKIKLRHFVLGQEAIDFIKNTANKKQLFLLADFELLRQELDGLQVAERAGLARSVLVTNQYNNYRMHNFAARTGIKLLPKSMMAGISIEIN